MGNFFLNVSHNISQNMFWKEDAKKGNPLKILSSYRKEVKDWPQVKSGDDRFSGSSLTFLSSVSVHQTINIGMHALDTPEMPC